MTEAGGWREDGRSLLHPRRGAAARDIERELGRSVEGRVAGLERAVERLLRYLVLRLRVFRGLWILSGPDAGARVSPDANGLIGIECAQAPETIRRVDGSPHRIAICPPAAGGAGCEAGFSVLRLVTAGNGAPLPAGECQALGCDGEIEIRLGDCLTGSIGCDAEGKATLEIGLDLDCICERCGGGGSGEEPKPGG